MNNSVRAAQHLALLFCCWHIRSHQRLESLQCELYCLRLTVCAPWAFTSYAANVHHTYFLFVSTFCTVWWSEWTRSICVVFTFRFDLILLDFIPLTVIRNERSSKKPYYCVICVWLERSNPCAGNCVPIATAIVKTPLGTDCSASVGFYELAVDPHTKGIK